LTYEDWSTRIIKKNDKLDFIIVQHESFNRIDRDVVFLAISTYKVPVEDIISIIMMTVLYSLVNKVRSREFLLSSEEIQIDAKPFVMVG